MVDYAVEEESVVTHYDQASLELGEVILEDAEGHDVEVVGRLVEYQEVGRPHQHSRKVKAGAFAATEGVDVLLLVSRREEEVGEKLHRGVTHIAVYHDVLGYLGDCVDDALVVVKLDSLLAVVAESHRFANVPLSAVGRHYALQHLDECRFAGSVVAYYSKLFVTCECVVEVVENHLVAKPLVYALCLEYL